MSDRGRVQAEISPGAFSGERVVRVPKPFGKTHQTVVPEYYCRDGWVEALLIRVVKDAVFVELPDGQASWVRRDAVQRRVEHYEWVQEDAAEPPAGTGAAGE